MGTIGRTKKTEQDVTLLRGWRMFKIADASTGLLQGRLNVQWPNTTMKAICLAGYSGRRGRHSIAKCHCGIYAGNSPKHYQVIGGMVIAEVVGWGEAVIGEIGWRARTVRIESLYVTQESHPSFIKALEWRYKVPVIEGLPSVNGKIRPLRKTDTLYFKSSRRSKVHHKTWNQHGVTACGILTVGPWNKFAVKSPALRGTTMCKNCKKVK